MKKRIISLLIVLTIIFTSACGSEENNENQEQELLDVSFPLEETMTITMFASQGSPQYDMYAEGGGFDILCKNANIEFEKTIAMTNETLLRKQLLLNSGEYPEVFYKAGFSDTEITKYAEQGILVPLEDLIRTYAPNLTKVLDERNLWEYMESSDGHVYSFYEINRADFDSTPLWINQKWISNLGLSMPTDAESLYQVLKAFKEQDANGNGDPNDEIPLTANADITTNLLLPYFVNEYSNSDYTGVDEDGNLYYVYTSEDYKTFVSYLTKLYSEGLLDSACYTQSHDQQGAIGCSGEIFGAFFDASPYLTVGKDVDSDYVILPSFEGYERIKTTGLVSGTMVITDVCEHPEVVVAWADQLYTEEGGILAWMGVEGLNYEFNEDGSYDYTQGENEGTVPGIMQGYINHPSIQPEAYFELMSNEEDLHCHTEKAKVLETCADPRPAVSYSSTDSKRIATLKSELHDYARQYQAEVVTGKKDLDSTWDEYVANMNAMGAEELQSIYVNAYNEAIK